jgi:hypothetical protein
MHGNVPEKIGRLAGHLASHPNDLIRYGRHCRSQPLDERVPWFSWAAIDFLKSHLHRGLSVFEYGSGGSTMFFAERAGRVVSVEDDAAWCLRVREHLATHGAANAQVIHATFDHEQPDAFATSEYVRSLNDTFDVIVVDGSENWPDEVLRPVCFTRGQRYVKAGGIIVVDDAWRYDGLIVDSFAKSREMFQGVGPGRFGVTRTDVYFY